MSTFRIADREFTSRLFVNKLSSSTGSGKSVVVAARALKSGSVIAAADVKTIQWPGAHTPKGTYESTGAVIGVIS